MIKFFQQKWSVNHQVADWMQGKTRVLFIGGLSGSGKSSKAKYFAQVRHAKVVGLDLYLRQLVREKTGSQTPDHHKEVFENGVKWLLEAHPEGQLVIEGVQVAWFNPEDLKPYSVMIVDTSWVKSTWRTICRDFTREHWEVWKCINPRGHIRFNLKHWYQLRDFAQGFYN